MTEVLIVYASQFGKTDKLAQSVAEGAASVTNTTVTLRIANEETVDEVCPADEVTIDEVRRCDALILGSHVHMGMLDWRIKKFIDSSVYLLWFDDELVGKVAGVFATGGGCGDAGSGVELTQIAMFSSLAECGMILVPFPRSSLGSELIGSRWGPYARSGESPLVEPDWIHEERLEAGRQYGATVARVAAALAGKDLFGNTKFKKDRYRYG